MIKDFQKDNNIIGFFAVKDITERETKDLKKYLDLTLVDASGQINAKAWDIAEAIMGEHPKRGDIVKVDAVTQEYKGTLQLKINKLRKATESDQYEPQTIIPSAPTPPDRMWAILIRFIEAIANDKLKVAVNTVIQQHKGRLMFYPAAKSNHHSYQGGLLQHITTMLLAAEKLTTVYSCNTDLLYSGIILHDIGKVYELATDETGLGTEFTLEGEMLGHIAIGLRVIEHMEALDVEKKLILQHMILSHHQTLEWGSPKRPMLKEAELLHHLDMIDSRLFDFEKATALIDEGTLSARVHTLERKVYRPILS
ncbi:MAG: OB-fold nucleic acid binding domain-containing protein [Desulfosporosinus sp.]|nr:OB-fold nucleic acid binding domain-containing protein [Desulfosporosinus sp.]